jgi:hypothetical protein
MIRAVLLHDWDPINVAADCPEDEYDDYIDPVLALLSDESKTEVDIATYLFKVKEETMGLGGISAIHSERSMRHCRKIAAKLLAFRNATS